MNFFKKTWILLGLLAVWSSCPLHAQKQKKKAEVVNDLNTPLHLLQPDYKVPYSMLTM